MTKKLKEKRQARNLSQSQLAEKTGLNIRTIQHYEQGSKNFDHAHLNTILRICVALDCSITDIIEDSATLELLKKLKEN